MRLTAVAEDLPNRGQWPTEVYYREHRAELEAELAEPTREQP